MIVQVIGTVIKKTLKSVYLDTGSGIVLEVFSTDLVLRNLRSDEKVTLYTYFKVKDDGMELYGFLNEKEREAFKILISISSIGPRTAIAILNIFTYDKLLTIVENEDINSLIKVPGIGKKSASRIILELAGKLVIKKTENIIFGKNFSDAKEGLLSMGFNNAYLEEQLFKLEKEDPLMSVKVIIKRVLKGGK